MKQSKEDEITENINSLLSQEISEEERNILLKTKEQIEKSKYFPQIIADIRSELTPLAVQNHLSKEVATFYLKITNHKWMSKGLGRGIFTVGKMFF